MSAAIPKVTTHLSAPRTSTGLDQYDHAINLIDSTRPKTPPAGPEDSDRGQDSSRNSTTFPSISAEDGIPVARIFSKSGLNQQLTRRKYARFQEHKYSSNDEDSESSVKPQGRTRAVLKSLDDRRGRALERLHMRPKKAGKTKDVQSAVDILYENQRGLFIFGYPLYSSRSLLNFDPSAWTNAQFEDSAVDIRNAQVPDPTWVWSWKRWYVDMSGDVDEQGWQYSLMFGKKFSWHGTHPWFHSAVRRRRWLRKRVKLQHAHHTSDAHDMAQDYFTIHAPKRNRSRGSSIASRTLDKSSRYSGRFEPAEPSDDEEEVNNIISLLHVMKNTSVDRKKLDAFQSFIDHGGDEIQLLPELMPEIWKLFLYQNSRRQLLSILERAEHKLEDSNDSSSQSTNRKSELRSTMKLIRDNLNSIEYYSDAQAMEKELDDHEGGHVNMENGPTPNEAQLHLEQIQPSKEPSKDTNIELTRISFHGIPKTADLDVEPGIARPGDTGNPSMKEG